MPPVKINYYYTQKLNGTENVLRSTKEKKGSFSIQNTFIHKLLSIFKAEILYVKSIPLHIFTKNIK